MVRLDEDDEIENVEEGNKEENVEFSWGSKKVLCGTNKDLRFYQSFCYDGVEYFLKDCVYLWGEDEVEPYIGKLLKIWETPHRKKKVKIVWFFRPIEIQHWLGDVKPLKNELFLASGKGVGVFNVNPLEAIAGKCKVICTSKDRRNIPASAEEMKGDTYFFCRTFDVDTRKISNKFPDLIAGHDVKHFFNQKKDLEVRDPPATQGLTVEDGDSSTTTKPLEKQDSKFAAGCGKRVRYSDEDTIVRHKTFVAKEVTGTVKTSSQLERDKFKSSTDFSQTVKKRKLESTSVVYRDNPTSRPEHGGRLLESKVSVREEKKSPTKWNFDQKACRVSDKEMGPFDKGGKAESQILEVIERPDVDKRNWFNQKDWDETMKSADKDGSLVLLENLDPSYTSSEVEDIIWHALGKKVSAKMVQRTTLCSPHFGEAYVIFNTKDVAEFAMSELYKKCLVLSGGRPVVARRRPTQREPSFTPSNFPGHIVIDKLKFKKQRQEMRNAVSTSHSSQPNTVEYEMAIEWRALQEKSRLWWNALFRQQADEIEQLRARLKTQVNVLTESRQLEPTL